MVEESQNNERGSSLFSKNHSAIEIVELELQAVTYRPLTSTTKSTKKTSDDKRTTVLSAITTRISPYKLTAWIGPSGSGKTSLTSVVAGLVDQADITEGTIKVNGAEGRLPKKMVGVVWQDDLLLSNLTPEESIYFAARLKAPASWSEEEVKALVEETMKELGLLHIRNNLIGSALANMPGISGGERKRVAVACELVVRPSLLLLDEPTSGLDATTARALMSTLKELTTLGHSIAVVIHQPRTDIFKMIDHLLLLTKGRVLYDGPTECVRSYLEGCPNVSPLPPETGIADWISDTIIADQSNEGGSVLANNWNTNQPIFENDSSSTNIKKARVLRKMSTLAELHETTTKFEASFSTQIRLLTRRTVKQRRLEKITRVSVLLTSAYLFFTCLFWWQLPNNTGFVFERNSLLFFMLIAQGNAIVSGSITTFQRDRALLHRDRAKKLYAVLPYFLGKSASDMSTNIVLPFLYGILSYFAAGLRPGFVPVLKFGLAYYLTLSTAQSMGFLLGILIPNISMALLLAPAVTLFQIILGGFYIPLSNLHVGVQWASYISFARYGYSALIVNEFDKRDIPCADDDIAISIGGSSECPLPGAAVYESLGIEGAFSNYWFSVGVLSLFQIFLLVGAYISLRRSK